MTFRLCAMLLKFRTHYFAALVLSESHYFCGSKIVRLYMAHRLVNIIADFFIIPFQFILKDS